MKKFVLVLALVFAFTAFAGKAFAAQSIALTGVIPSGGYPQAVNPAPAHVSNNIRMAQAQSINLTGQLPSISKSGAGATAAIPSINLTGVLPDGAQGLTASDGNIGAGVAILTGLGYLFTVRLLTLHF
jgi:hypothetical protein